MYVYIYVHTFKCTPTYRSSTIHFPPADSQRTCWCTALCSERRRSARPSSSPAPATAASAAQATGCHGENRGTATKNPVASWFFSSISSHHVSKSFQTSRNTPNCEFAKHIIAKVCGLNMIERQFWIFLGMQQLDAIGISLAKHMTALERTLLQGHWDKPFV